MRAGVVGGGGAAMVLSSAVPSDAPTFWDVITIPPATEVSVPASRVAVLFAVINTHPVRSPIKTNTGST